MENNRGTKEMRELAMALIVLIHWGISASTNGFKYLFNNLNLIIVHWGTFQEGFKGIDQVDDELFDLTDEEAEAEKNFVASQVSTTYHYAQAKAKAIAIQTYAIVLEIGVLINIIKSPAQSFETQDES